MRLTNYFLQQIKSKLFDQESFPRQDNEVVGISVGDLRKLVNTIEFSTKEPYNADKYNRGLYETTSLIEQG